MPSRGAGNVVSQALEKQTIAPCPLTLGEHRHNRGDARYRDNRASDASCHLVYLVKD